MSDTSVLVIEDEEPIRVGLCDVLAYHGLSPDPAVDGDEGLRKALANPYALMLVDVMLPGVDGFEICRRVRAQRPSQAMLLLTAKGAESDVLTGFAAGADDYVTKPFSVAQLMARVQALLRRSGVGTRRRFEIGTATIDADALVVEAPGGKAALSPRDVEILAYLASRPGVVVSREELLREVWRFARVDHVETRCIDMHLSKLRKKLTGITDGDLIETVRGAGYRAAG